MLKNSILLVVMCIALISCSGIKQTPVKATANLEGTWELNYINGPRIAFDGLYPDKKPTISFDTKENRVSGNNGCNSYSGNLIVTDQTIDLTVPMAVTKMMCINGQQGEQTYMSTLPKINKYAVSEDGKTLSLISGDIAMMRFTKQ